MRTPRKRRARQVAAQQRHAKGVGCCAIRPTAQRPASRGSGLHPRRSQQGPLSCHELLFHSLARKHPQRSTACAVGRRAALRARWAAGAHPAHVVLEDRQVLQDVVLDRAHVRRADLSQESPGALGPCVAPSRRPGSAACSGLRLATRRRAPQTSMLCPARACVTRTARQCRRGYWWARRQGGRTRCC